MAPYKILKQGYMLKEPPVSKRGIRKRVFRYWFVLVEDRSQVALVYFKTEDAYIARLKNEGFIRVDDASNISVIGEHMGHKNAFLVKTPKGEYHLMPESRYDLHEWLFTIHNALENFRKKVLKAKQRKETEGGQRSKSDGQRSRSNTTEGRQGNKPSTTAGHTPPYRRAPPPPMSRGERGGEGAGGAGAGGDNNPAVTDSPRRKPTRPAPTPPSGGGRRRTASSSSAQRLSQEVPPTYIEEDTPPPSFSSSLPSNQLRALYREEGWGSVEGDPTHQQGEARYGTLESNTSEYTGRGVVIIDLDISQTDQDHSPSLNEDKPTSIAHARSSSDSLIVRTLSNSLNDLTSQSTSPEVEGEEPRVQPPRSPRAAGHGGHTRHLSLLGGSPHKSGGGGGRNKKKPKRGGSIKQRSRSPPNLPPPPPPPPSEPTDAQQQLAEGGEEDHHLSPSSGAGAGAGLSHATSSTASLGFSQVLNTISTIDQELDQMAGQFITPPQPSEEGGVDPSSFGNYPGGQEVEGQEVTSDFHFEEDEWLCDIPPQDMGSHNAHVMRSGDQVVTSNYAPISKLTNEAPSFEQDQPLKVKPRVMFKDEVEAIPNYEPRVDDESSATPSPLPDDQLAVGVAAIKLKLFGQKEEEATRYKKEGMLSPKNVNPNNITFNDNYFREMEAGGEGYGQSLGHRDSSPNMNNNNSASEEDSVVSDVIRWEEPRFLDSGAHILNNGMQETHTLNTGNEEAPQEYIHHLSNGKEEPLPHNNGKEEPLTHSPMFPDDPAEPPNQNMYESPWEEKSISKYKGIGIRRRSASDIKEKTPPPVMPKKVGPQKMKFAEVSIKNTPKPSAATELRNVHSLERPLRHSPQATPPSPPTLHKTSEDSLLASISSTLQVTSRYGSDSFLSNGGGEVGGGGCGNSPLHKEMRATSTSELKMSARRELEKIRAAHRREAAPNVPHPSPLTQAMKPDQRSSPQLYPPQQPRVLGGGASSSASAKARGVHPPPRHSSLDGLLQQHPSPETHVMYDSQTQAHIFRSLV